MEQKLIQRGETKVDADACKASYHIVTATEAGSMCANIVYPFITQEVCLLGKMFLQQLATIQGTCKKSDG